MFEKVQEPRIVYMGTPEISANVLKGLIEAGFTIVGLVCNEDKITGRKGKIEPPATKVVALERGIPVFQPHRIKTDYEWLKDLKPDVIVTMAYGQIVPKGVLEIPPFGCINLHGSLLPKLRGAAPMQRAIINGEAYTGVTLMEMVEKMDAGRMYDSASVKINDDDNYSTLSIKIGEAAKNLIVKDLLSYLNGELPGKEQNEEEVTFAAKILPPEEHLDLSLDANSLLRYIRGLSKTPGGYLSLEGKKVKIYSAVLDSYNESSNIGEIVDDHKKLVFQAKGGTISILSLQMEGKKEMDAKSFLNGNHDLKGKRFD